VFSAKRFLSLWVPVLAWMAVIFMASTDAFSTTHTSRFLGPLVRWLLPGAPEDRIGDILFFIRKCAHGSEYAVLTFLVWRALRRPVKADPRGWSWNHAGGAWLVATAYAASDEWHQSFVPSRGAAVGDVLIDSAGALIGLALVWVVGRWFRRW